MTLQPDNSSVHDIKGWLFFLKRQWGSMIAEAETVIADDPNNAVAHAQIGFSKMFLGHAEDGFADVETAHGPILFAFSNLQTAWKRFV